MGSYSVRDTSLAKDINYLKNFIREVKTKQAIGKDVITPKIIQRYKPDGTPTDHDLEGAYNSSMEIWQVIGTATFTANNQQEGVIARPFFVGWSTSSKNGLSNYGSVSVYPDASFDMIAGNEKKARYTFFGSDGTLLDPNVDRLYIKVYFYTSDFGSMSLSTTTGSVVTA